MKIGAKHSLETRLRMSKSKGGKFTGSANPMWKGGRRRKDGYIFVMNDGQLVREHRLIMEKIIGRRLLADEVVHHKNGNTIDNFPENLELMTNSEHVKHHKLGQIIGEERNILRRVLRKCDLLGWERNTLLRLL